VGRYLLRRTVFMVPLLVGISLISYAIVRFAPGDPTRLLVDPEHATAEQFASLRQELGLDDPLPVQYLKTMKTLLTGELRSFKTRQRVIEIVWERLPVTVLLGGLSLLLATLAGMTIGAVQALRASSTLDEAGTVVSLVGFSVPSFWLALMFIMLFAVHLHWLPASGIRPVGAGGWNLIEMAPYLVLPTIVLGTTLLASIARYTRSSMLEALAQDYVRTARAKGLPQTLVITRHALRNSLLPVITLIGLYLPVLVGGAVVVETIFAIPGIGRLGLESVFIRDYPVILSVNVMGAAAVLVGNLLADVAYALADPRIRFG
jgi:peptide/nickel transport system permease protein